MHNTQVSLLAELNANNREAWQEFCRLYKPMISHWLKSHALQATDVEDISQEILLFLLENIDSFEHNGRIGAFRNWLRLVTVNIARNYLRKVNTEVNLSNFSLMLEQLEDADSNQSHLFNLAHDRVVVQILLENLAEHFQPETLTIFKLHVVDDLSAIDTAAQMNVSIASVHVTKSRVLRRLRQDAKTWLDDLCLMI